MDASNFREDQTSFKQNIEDNNQQPEPSSSEATMSDSNTMFQRSKERLIQNKLMIHIEINSDGIILSIPDLIFKWLNLDPTNQLVDKPLKSIIHPSYHEKVNHLIKLSEQPSQMPYTEFVLLAFGNEVKTSALLILLPKENNSDTIYLSLSNLTTSLYTADSLQNYHSLFNEAQRMNKTGFWFHDEETNVVSWSEEMYRIHELPFDYNPNDQETIKNLIHPEDRERFSKTMSEAIQKKSPTNIDYRIKLPDQTVKFLSLKTEFIQSSNETYFRQIGAIQDKTDQYIATQKSNCNEQLFKSMFTGMTDIFLAFELERDPDGAPIDYRYREINPAFEQKFAISREALIGEKLSGHLPSLFQQLHPKFKISALTNEPLQDRIYLDIFDGFYDILVYLPEPNIIATILRDVSLMVEADNSLRESEEKYRQLFTISSDSLLMVDYASGRIIDTNNTALQFLGYNKEQLYKLTFPQITISPTETEELIRLNKSTLSSININKANETTVPVDLTLTYFNWSGRKVYMVSARDASERLASQMKLIESEQKFKIIYEQSPDAILIIKNYRIIELNQKALELFNLDASELLHKTIWNISTPRQTTGEDSRLMAVEYIQNVMLGSTSQFEWTFLINNKPIHAEVKLKLINTNTEKNIQFVVRDISSRKEQEKRLNEKNERYNLALEGGNIGIWDWNLTTNDIYFSPEWKNIIGFSDNEFPNKIEEFKKRIHPDDIESVFNQIDGFIDSKIPIFSIEFRIQSKNGSYKWICSKAKIHFSAFDNKPQRLIGTHEDITRFKIKEINLKTQEQKHNEAFALGRLGFWELDLRNMLFTGPAVTFEMFEIKDATSSSLKSIENMVHPDDKDLFMSQFLSPTNQKENLIYFRILNEKGTSFIQSKAKPIFDSRKTLSSYYGIFQDISSFKNEEIQLRYKESILDTFQNNPFFGSFILHNDRIIFHTSKILDITGLNSTQIYADDFDVLSMFESNQTDEIHNYFSKTLIERKTSERMAVSIRNKYGRERWVEMQATQTNIDNNLMLLVTFFDITNKYIELQNLAINESNLYQAINVSIEGLIIIDSDKKVIFINKPICELTGYTQAEIIKNGIASFVHSPIKSDIFTELFGLAEIEGHSSSTELFISAKNDSIHWIKLRIHKQPNKKNGFNYAIYFENNDQFRKITIQLAERDIIAKTLWINNSDAIALFDNNQRLEFANDHYNLLFKDINNEGQYQYIKNALGIRAAHFFKLLPKGESEITEFEKITEDSKTLQIKLIPLKFFNGNGFFITIRDISIQLKETSDLQQKLSKYFQIVENAPIGIAIIDKNRSITQCNPLFANVFGYDTTDLKDKKLETLFPITSYDDLITRYAHLFSGLTEQYDFELQITKKDGTTTWTQNIISSIKDKYGDTSIAIAIVEDLSVRKEKELKTLKEEQYNTIRKISSGIANRFNNHLMAIYGNAYILQNNLLNNPDEKYVNSIQHAVKEANDLIQKIMITSGNGKFIQIYFNLNQVLEESIQHSTLLIKTGISIQKKLRVTNPWVFGDPQRIGASINYLIINSALTVNPGGTIFIESDSVFYESEYEINETATLKAGKYIRLRITDNGKKQDDAMLKQIFEPFFENQSDHFSSGLDLSTAFNIIKTHRGNISVIANKEKGKSFNIYLPQVDESIKTTNQDFSPDEQIIIKGIANIMLVDDEDIVRNITSELLQKLGYNVFSFATGKKAQNFYQENKNNIDLVLIDLNMPEMNGAELYKHLKTINPNIKAALLTGFGRDQEIEEILNLGFNTFIQKPVGISQLSTTISTILTV